jgi:hypothetical protein
MRRLTGLAALLAAVVGTATALSGCSGGGSSTEVLPTVKAPPQTAELGWVENYPADGPALVFGVQSFTVTEDGWRAQISVQNRSDVSWDVGSPKTTTELQFGVMLFPNNDLEELERRNRQGDLPAIRDAISFTPALPSALRPGTTWRGTMSAPGALAGGLWVRVSFGPFLSEGDAPPGAQSPVVWFTDHAYHLGVVAAQPA